MSIRTFAPIALAAVVVTMRAQDQQKPFRVTTNSVAIYATVTVPKNGWSGPRVDDFEIYDNGKLQTR